MPDQFGKIRGPRIPRTPFNLSYGRRFSAEMGLLYPVAFEECLPSDSFKNISYESVFRASPLLAPILHRIDVYYHAFYAPTRILTDTEQEAIDFFTGGEDGTDSTTLPTWNPSAAAKRNAGTLWDMLYNFQGVTPDADSLPLDFGRRMYMDIFNEWFRDIEVEPAIDWTQAVGSNLDMDGNALPTGYNDDEDLQPCAWAKDYFTAARTTQQLGSAETLPISGVLNVVGDSTSPTPTFDTSGDATPRSLRTGTGATTAGLNSYSGADASAEWVDPNLQVDLSGATTFNVADMRLSLMKQRWKELNARAGVRWPEYIHSHWNQSVGDQRVGRPEFIGAAKAPIVVSEISYNAEGASDPVGTLTGKATGMGSGFIGKFRAPEHGYLMILMSIRPKGAYAQGIHRQHTRRTRYDFYDPMFQNLSEQSILQRELYVDTVKGNNETVFGYIPAWDDYRVRMDVSNGLLAPGQSFDYWHLTREFSAAPTLSASFIRMHDIRDDAWAVPAQPHFFVHHQNIITVVRPMPAISTPGIL